MELYITVAFWLGLVSLICRIILLAGKHPRTVTYSAEIDTLRLIISIALFAWVAYINFHME